MYAEYRSCVMARRLNTLDPFKKIEKINTATRAQVLGLVIDRTHWLYDGKELLRSNKMAAIEDQPCSASHRRHYKQGLY